MAETKDSEERRNEFVEAAEKLFREHGIVDTTINSIVKEMNVAKGLFYYYFKSKDDVIDVEHTVHDPNDPPAGQRTIYDEGVEDELTKDKKEAFEMLKQYD